MTLLRTTIWPIHTISHTFQLFFFSVFLLENLCFTMTLSFTPNHFNAFKLFLIGFHPPLCGLLLIGSLFVCRVTTWQLSFTSLYFFRWWVFFKHYSCTNNNTLMCFLTRIVVNCNLNFSTARKFDYYSCFLLNKIMLVWIEK